VRDNHIINNNGYANFNVNEEQEVVNADLDVTLTKNLMTSLLLYTSSVRREHGLDAFSKDDLHKIFIENAELLFTQGDDETKRQAFGMLVYVLSIHVGVTNHVFDTQMLLSGVRLNHVWSSIAELTSCHLYDGLTFSRLTWFINRIGGFDVLFDMSQTTLDRQLANCRDDLMKIV